MKSTWIVAATLVALAGCSSVRESPLNVPLASGPSAVGSDEATGERIYLTEVDEPLTERVPIAGSDFVRGRARVIVQAPASTVRATLFDFKNYPEFMPFWDTARIVGKRPDGSREVYMSVKLLYGAMRLWARVEVPKPQTGGGLEEYDEKYVEGNLKALEAKWRIRPIDEQRTELGVDVLMHPNVPLPLDVVNNAQTDGARMLVDAVRLRAEGRDDD